jgi:predicted amidophosphoribosyltransferase
MHFFLRCIACETNLQKGIDNASFPLCALCSQNLLNCPELCSNCASPICPTQNQGCTRPWIQNSLIGGFSARYLLLPPTYQVLKKWKTRRGRLFDHQILKSSPQLLHQWKIFQPHLVVPIPQRFHRAWKMRGSRAEIIAQWVGHELQIPKLTVLKTSDFTQKRQAEMPLTERFQNSIRFLANSNSCQNKNVILVDDFMTTGHTIKQAAHQLKLAGASQVHVFCLGVRTFRSHP